MIDIKEIRKNPQKFKSAPKAKSGVHCDVLLLEKTNQTKTCFNCKWWGPKEVEDRSIQESLPCLNRKMRELMWPTTPHMNSKSITLASKPEFGCVSWEQR